MTEMLKTIEPKSDQLNADDLIGGRTLTIKITDVTIGAGDQPVTVRFEGDNGKPYKPGKSMRRVFVHAWGLDRKSYIGQSITLYRDDSVKFGAVEVGGIRISHMTGIDREMTVALTATRGSRKPFTVQPLAEPPANKPVASLVDQGHACAEDGMSMLEGFWKNLTPAEKHEVGGQAQLESWKRIATDAGKERA